MSEHGGLEIQVRHDLYALAARLFAAEIDPELYRQLISNEIEQLMRPTGLVWIDPELRAMPEEQAVEELAVEFCRLFIGPQPLCPPYESSQRGDALLGGGARRRLEEFMAHHDLALAEDLPVASPDHLSVELSVLACIYDGAACEGGMPGHADPITIAREFLKGHLLTWAPRFLQTVEASAVRAPYQVLAQLTSALLEEERLLHGL